MDQRRIGRPIGLVLALALFDSGAMITGAIGQPAPDPVLSAFRAYKAAQDRRDLPAAEVAAKRALSLAEARGGDKSTTAALAMNLAITEMSLDHKSEALAPARRALDLSRAGAKGVDELQAQLIIGEAELTVDPNADERPLLAALKSADGREGLDDYVYPAAMALARRAQTKQQWNVALDAWRSAESHVPGSGTDHQLMVGRALTAESMVLVALHQDDASIKASTAALQLLNDLAPEAPDDRVYVGEQSYAEALAARSASSARRKSEADEAVGTGSRILPSTPPQTAPLADRPSLPGKPAFCSVNLRPEPLPTFPEDMRSEYVVGAVVLRINTSAQGEVLKTRVLAALPTGSFVTAVSDPKIKWKLTLAPDAQPGCRLASFDQIAVVRFAIE